MEVAPIFIVTPVLIVTYRRFPLTTFVYLLIALHALVLIIGGVYTYARVPLGFWIQDIFNLSRNPYDKIGHFMQGFVPAIVTREILLRGKYVSGKRMCAFLAICVAMAISACYEIIEWFAAVTLGQGADAFLGTQGDVWDTQSDMFLCLIGSTIAMVGLPKFLDLQIQKLKDTLT
jgi:putative membrane protein